MARFPFRRVAKATQQVAQTPAAIEQAMAAQGMDTSTQLGPGRPINPAWGYSQRPRAMDYPVGVNIATGDNRAAWGRTSYSTLKAIIDAYDVARMCCVPGTLVLTQRGTVVIENVEVGDLVLTHMGRWRRVTEWIENAPGRAVYSVQASALDPLMATGNHPVLAATYQQGPTHRRQFTGAEWRSVEELRTRGRGKVGARFDGLTLPVMTFGDRETLDTAATLGDAYVIDDGMIVPSANRRNATPIPASVPFDAAFGRILGWYLAEGSISGGRNVFFSLGPDEGHYAKQIAVDLFDVFGLHATVHPSSTGRGITIRASSTPLAKLLSCGTARTKTVPAWAWDGGRKFFAAVLDSWATGDGCIEQRGEQSARIRVATSSRSLAWQMRLVAIGLGYEASVVTTHLSRTSPAVIRGEVVNTHPIAYRVEWRDNPVRWGTQSFEADGRLLATAVRSIEPVAYDGPVYNLEVEDDHSFVTTGGTVHNCINHKIDELRSMEPLFQPVDGFSGDADAAIEAARTALEFPDRETPFDAWLSKWLESVLRYDAGYLYRRRNFDGQVMGLEVIDGTTIAPLLDEHGRRPHPPAPAWQMIAKGLRTVDLTTDDLVPTIFRPQADSPFGLAPMESILLTANTDLRWQWHFLQMFTEGSIPAGFMELPPDISSPDQVDEWQQYWDSLVMGDQAKLHQIIAVPNGSKLTETRPKTFDKTFPQYLMTRTAAAFGVVPQDLGLIDDVNRANGETQVDVQFRVNVLPWVRFVEGVLSRYLRRDLGLPVQVKLDTGRDKEDRVAEAQAWAIYIANAVASADEARQELLGLPVDNERPVPRGFLNPRTGFVPLRSAFAISGPVDPETGGPADDLPLDTTPFDGAGGVLADKSPGGSQFKRAPIDPDEPRFPQLEQEVPGSDVLGTVPGTKPLITDPAQGQQVQAVQDQANPVTATANKVDADNTPKAIAKAADELAAFRRFRKARLAKGSWRDFQFTSVPPEVAAELNEQGRELVEAGKDDGRG